MRFSFLLVAMVLVAGVAQTEPVCSPSSTATTQNYPGKRAIPPTNNLLKAAGKARVAAGQRLVIQGRILDTQCKPVPDAVVELWQNSPTGRWLLASREDLASASAIFNGAGRTYTDGDGNFTFITAFPAPLTYQVRNRDGKGYATAARAPFINIKVTGRGLPDLDSALFFSGDARNDKDKQYMNLSEKARRDTLIQVNGEGESLSGTIQLVIASRAPYRTY